ncbi:MAG: CoA transferase [Alphaproteobacteria bacterium]|nr:CoA transferase [Alphaproteobacteria bacterium]
MLVIDCASFIAGPAAATIMSDFGARAIKIEPPGADRSHATCGGTHARHPRQVRPRRCGD